jgi:hypothetical protein
MMVGWDAACAAVALWAGFVLRLGDFSLPSAVHWWYLLVPAIVVPPVFWFCGLAALIAGLYINATRPGAVRDLFTPRPQS